MILLNFLDRLYGSPAGFGMAILVTFLTLFLLANMILKRRGCEQSGGDREDPLSVFHSKRLMAVSLLVILLFMAPYFFKGEDIHMKISDVLNAWVPQQKVLAESGRAFSWNPGTKIENIANGLHLSGFIHGGYHMLTWLFMMFRPFTAIAVNAFIMSLTAFFGMLLLMNRYILKDRTPGSIMIVFGSALCFSLLPFYPPGGLSVAGLPLLTFSFLNIRKGEGRWGDYLFMFFFPFYSVLPFMGIFVLFISLIVLVFDRIRLGRLNGKLAATVVFMTVLYGLTNFHMLQSFLDPGFVSYRTEIKIATIGFGDCFKDFLHNLVFDRSNVVGAQHVFVIGSAILALIVSLRKYTRHLRLLVFLLFVTTFNAFLWGFKYWHGTEPLRRHFQLMNVFNPARFFWMNPFLWYVIFGISLMIILSLKGGKWLAAGLIIGQVFFMFSQYNWEYRYMTGRKLPRTHSFSYREYFSTGLFNRIARHIGRPMHRYRVVSIGIPAGIAQYNGFYTLDLFCNIYPLEYKHSFRRIIRKELEKNPRIKRTFDDVGKRCYILPAEFHQGDVWIGMVFSRGISKDENQVKLRNLELDTAALKEMGGEYILSSVEIANYAENRLFFERVFKNNRSPWKIYLYRVR